MSAEPGSIRGVVFDVDGTLYHQGPLRRRMAGELLLATARRPAASIRTIRILKTFRSVREQLRERGRPPEPLEELQYSTPAALLAIDVATVRAVVEEWIHRRPLRHLRACRRGDLRAALDRLCDLGLRLAVFSDYAAEAKLEALGVADRFEASLSATAREINAFKPHPAGFLEAARRLGVEAHRTLYVGDREDVDARGADAAGMRSALVGSGPAGAPSLEDLLARHGWRS